jgi:hypothetical protein
VHMIVWLLRLESGVWSLAGLHCDIAALRCWHVICQTDRTTLSEAPAPSVLQLQLKQQFTLFYTLFAGIFISGIDIEAVESAGSRRSAKLDWTRSNLILDGTRPFLDS